jgi:DNA repair exonuclease SbcCD ATPase subunit
MILHTLRAAGFRCFASPIALPALSPGLNILHGPNASGKSTLLRALRHLFADSFSLSGQIAESHMRPRGRDLAPTLSAEFEHDARRYRFSKRFFDQPHARLEIFDNGRFELIKEGKQADEAVRRLLLAEAPSKGLASEAHLGILQILWTPQGPPALANIPSAVRASIEHSFGAASLSPRAQTIVDAIAAEYSLYFTDKGAHKKSANSPLFPRQQQLAELAAEVHALNSKWTTAAQDRERARALDDELAALATVISTTQRELAALEQKAAKFAELRLEAAGRANAATQAHHAYKSLHEKIEAWISDKTRHREAATELAALENSLLAKREEADKTSRRVDELNDRKFQLAQAHRYHSQSAAIAQLRHLLAELDKFRAVDQDLLEQINALAAPPASDIPKLQTLLQTLAVTRAQLEAASLKLTFTPEAPAQVEVLRGAPAGQHAAAPDAPLVFTGPEGVSLRIPGVGAFHAESANAAAAGLAQKLAALEKDAAAYTANANGATLETVLVNAQKRKELEAAKAANLDAAKAATQGRKRLALEDELQRLSAELDKLATTPPPVPTQKPEDLDPDLEFANDAKTQAAAALSTALERRKNIEKTLQDLERKLTAHQSGPSLESLTASRTEAALAHDTARARLGETEKQLAALGPDPSQEISRLQSALHRNTALREQKKQQLDFLQGTLHQAAGESLYGELAAAEERKAQLDAEVNRHQRRAAALERLQKELDSASLEVAAAVPQNVAGAANVFWKLITGAPALVLNADLELDSLDAQGLRAPSADLSGGETEQASFALRLALAHQLAAHQRQLAVFDDSFLATDPARTARILDILEESAASRLQILILTCHPERYITLSNAHLLDLQVLKQEAQPA